MSPAEPLRPATVVSALVEIFLRLGVRDAFGVSGGAMAGLWDALSSSSLGVYHFRHETGAAFAAIEAGFASGRPTVLFTTTGPGLTNALTGIVAARDERARVIVVSAHTSASSRGRFAIQETSRSTLPPSLYNAGRPFHFATLIDEPNQLAPVERELAAGLRRCAGFVAHLALDTAVQRAPATPPDISLSMNPAFSEQPSAGQVTACIDCSQRRPVRDLGRIRRTRCRR